MHLDKLYELGAEAVGGSVFLNRVNMGQFTPNGFELSEAGKAYFQAENDAPAEVIADVVVPAPAKKPGRKPKAEAVEEAPAQEAAPAEAEAEAEADLTNLDGLLD